MKFEDDNELARVDEGEPSRLGDFVRAARNRRPSALVSARIAARLAPARAAAAARSRHVGHLERTGVTKVGGLAVVALGAALVVWQVRSSDGGASPEVPVAAPVVTRTPGASLVERTGDAPRTTVDVPTMPVEALPSSEPAVAGGPSRGAAARPARRPDTASALPGEDEFALIQRAQEELASDPVRALATLEVHARSFPAGELTQERETMAVEALARVNRKAEARTRANALLTRFPRTPYVARLERALGEPLAVARPSNTVH